MMEDLDKIILDPKPDQILGVPITIETIQDRIKQLDGQEGDTLKKSMAQLRIALRANPEACNLLLPEDIGKMVQHIYKMTKTTVVKAVAERSVARAKKVDLSNLKEIPSDF